MNIFDKIRKAYKVDFTRNDSIPELSFECSENDKSKMFKYFEKDKNLLKWIDITLTTYMINAFICLSFLSLMLNMYLILGFLILNFISYIIYIKANKEKFEIQNMLFSAPVFIADLLSWAYIKYTAKKFIYEKEVSGETIKVNRNMQEYKYKKGRLHSENCEPAIKREYDISIKIENLTLGTNSSCYIGDYYYEGEKIDSKEAQNNYEQVKLTTRMKNNVGNF